jgi:hypothetical protein
MLGSGDFQVELRGFEPCAFEFKAHLVVPEKNCNSRCFLIMVARRIATLCCRERSIVHITANQLSSDRLSEADRLSRTRFCLSLGF